MSVRRKHMDNGYLLLVRQLICNYLLGSFIAVVGVGGSLIFSTLHMTTSEIQAIAEILVWSLVLTVIVDTIVFRRHMRPIRVALATPCPSPEQFERAYKQTLRLPVLAVARVMGPHWLSFTVPGLVWSIYDIHQGILALPITYVGLAALGTLLVASMHAVTEFFLTSRSTSSALVALRRRCRSLYGKDVALSGEVIVPLRSKFAMSAVVFGTLPMLLFGLANGIRLLDATSSSAPYWSWATSVLVLGSSFSALGGWLLAADVRRPISQLEHLMRRVREGDLKVRAEDTYMDEFSNLIQGFNHMVQGLAERDMLNQQLVDSYFATLAAALDARDPYTAGHSIRVAAYAEAIGRQVGLAADVITQLRQSALLHDIGKIGIRDEVLLKDGRLTDEEFAVIQQHPVIGESIVRQIQPDTAMKPLLPGIRSHHERYDGKGYPDGLSGSDIPLFGRILAVADAYDAMTSDRPYRAGMAPERAIAILLDGRGTQWDPVFVDAFVAAQEHPTAAFADANLQMTRQVAASTKA
ncbi:HD-GYP domain-containing protein [Alicyclobacillus hesperidum]|uniref:HD-GYP domain-containing protein n=1 Tax=Alicyclobacillus hesperidum TaxID=89784 RepID=UPI00249013C4|nr:HD-GYP domain-containing protein [Alicyclobacillus hesperidum]